MAELFGVFLHMFPVIQALILPRPILVSRLFRFLWYLCDLGFILIARIALYACDCVILFNLAPDNLKSGSVSMVMASGSCFCLPSSAKWSASSFPSMPECPLTHFRFVVAYHACRAVTMACIKMLFSIPIYP